VLNSDGRVREGLGKTVFTPDPGHQEFCGDEDGPSSAHGLGSECVSAAAWPGRGRDAAQEEGCAQGVSNAGHQSHAWS